MRYQSWIILFGCLIGMSAIAFAREIKLTFISGERQSYENRTTAAVGAEAGDGNDFVITCASTSACETAWRIVSDRISIPVDMSGYVLDFEIHADSNWSACGFSDTWGFSLRWFSEGGKLQSVNPVSPLFHKAEDFVRFRFCGKIPEQAVAVEVAFGMDDPNLSPQESVIVRNATLTVVPKGEALPKELVYDVDPPLVYSRFKAPTPNPNLTVKYEIVDSSEIDWENVVVRRCKSEEAIPFERNGNLLTLKPGLPWKSGVNAIDIRVSDKCGNARVAHKSFLVGNCPSTTVVSLRDDGVTLVDGRPFFPVGIYSVSPTQFNCWDLNRAVADLKRAGINLVQSYTHARQDEFLDAVKKNGIYSFTFAQRANLNDEWLAEKAKTESVLAWYTGDDTSTHVKPADLLDRDEAVHMLDGTRLSCQADVIQGNQSPSRLARYVNFADVIMPEVYYWFNADPKKEVSCVAYVIRDMKRIKEEIEAYGDGKPKAIWPILQSFDGRAWKGYPTVEALNAMCFAALVHGGTGVVWFHYAGEKDPEKGRRYSGVFRTRENWSAFTNLTTRISALAPVFLERTPKQPRAPIMLEGQKTDYLGNPSVSMLVKKHNGFTYVFAVNASLQDVRARIFVDISDCEGAVAWEGRRIQVCRGEFEDSFGGYGVHVYRFPACTDKDEK